MDIRPGAILTPPWIPGQTLKVETVPTSGNLRCTVLTDTRPGMVGRRITVRRDQIGDGRAQYRIVTKEPTR